MKKLFLPALLALALTACKPHPSMTEESSVIVFAGSGFSLEPGPGWIPVGMKKLSQPLKQSILEPALTARGATIQVAVLGDRTTEAAVLAQVNAAFEADGQAVRDSLTQGDFQADSGVRGKFFRYSRHSEHVPDRIINHLTQYIVQSAGGRWISIGAMTDTLEHANEVDAMIRRTLRDVLPNSPTPKPTS